MGPIVEDRMERSLGFKVLCGVETLGSLWLTFGSLDHWRFLYFCLGCCLSYWLIAEMKCMARSNVRKAGAILLHGFRVQSVVAGKAWWQKLEARERERERARGGKEEGRERERGRNDCVHLVLSQTGLPAHEMIPPRVIVGLPTSVN